MGQRTVLATDRALRTAGMWRALGAALLLAAMVAPAAAQSAVDLQLVLAVDASGSVNHYRFELQKQGYVAAFRHARVLQAIRSGANQAIAATMVQWTGPAMQVQVADWSRITDQRSAEAFAAAIEDAPRHLFGGGTSISGAIDHAVTLFPKSPFRGGRRVIDISGDGSNNRGRSVTLARDEAVAAGIGINGLPILALEPDLDRYYYDYVIGGPGAFVIATDRFETFGEAILKKLITEIAAKEGPALKVAQKWRGGLALLPLPPKSGLPDFGKYEAVQVGYIRLGLGEGWGEGLRSIEKSVPPSPQPSPKGRGSAPSPRQ